MVAEKACRLFDPSMLSSLWTRLTKQPNLTENEKWQKVSPSRCFLSVQTRWWDDHAWCVILHKCVLLHKCVQECAMAFMCQQTHFHWKKCFLWKVSQWSSEQPCYFFLIPLHSRVGNKFSQLIFGIFVNNLWVCTCVCMYISGLFSLRR